MLCYPAGIQNLFVQQDKQFYCKRKEFESSVPTLNYTRILGLPDLPHEEQWLESEDCWICEKWLYTVLFWNKKIGMKFYVSPQNSDPENGAFIEQMTQRIAHRTDEVMRETPGVPVVCSSFNFWQQERMHSTYDFCKLIDKTYKDPELPTNDQGRTITTKAAHDWLAQRWEEIRRRYTKYFDSVFEKYLAYKPMYVHYPKSREQLFFVHTGFLKPGRHNVAVSLVDDEGERHDYFYHFLVKLRDEELKICTLMPLTPCRQQNNRSQTARAAVQKGVQRVQRLEGRIRPRDERDV